MTFDEQLSKAIQKTVNDFISKGDWLKIDYNSKVNIDSELLRKAHSNVDMNKVMGIVAGVIEQKIADTIMNSMATEISNDVKSIMSNKELREDIRALIRAKIREAHTTVS